MEPLDCRTGRDLLRAGLSEEGIEVVVAGVEAIWRGRSLAPDDVVVGRPDLAAEVFGTLADAGRAEIDEQGRLFGVHGFTLRKTRHGIVHDGTTHHVWCGFDSIGIPAAFGLDAVATTDCPTCGRSLSVDIHGGAPRDRGIVLWLPVPEGTSHLMQQFCASADLYCSRAHLDRRDNATAGPGRVLTLAEAAELGRETWADVAHAELLAEPVR